MELREAGLEDVGTVVEMRLAFVAEHGGVTVDSFSTDFVTATRQFVSDGQRADRLVSWLAEAAGQCVGVVSLLVHDIPPRPSDPRDREGYVLNMYVVPESRRSGVGAALFEACVQGAQQRRLRRVVLHATDDGRDLYRRAGFRTNDDLMELRLPAEPVG